MMVEAKCKSVTALRTHNCNDLSIDNKGAIVKLCGWVQSVRDKGKIIWIDLRDHYGITQLVLEDTGGKEPIIEKLRQLSRESIIQVVGKVIERASKNSKIPTGEIEVDVMDVQILNKAKEIPFLIEDDPKVGEELRMQNRYIDLRRPSLQRNIVLRHKVVTEVRNYFNANNFVEIETPILIKSTPGGAKDFLVPSSTHPNHFYALPQSPQLFKQLLVIGGFDKYYQISRCFRDEDLRSDRQPEFTQIDYEMAFVTQDDVMNATEQLVKSIFKNVRNVSLPDFPRITYEDSIKLYGTDKPDLRFGMHFTEVTELLHASKLADDFAAAICVPNGSETYTRSNLDKLSDFLKSIDSYSKPLIYIKNSVSGDLQSSVNNVLDQEKLKYIARYVDAGPKDLILILKGEKNKTRHNLSELRLKVGREVGLVESDSFKPLWVKDFPLFGLDDKGHYESMHHPFTSPKEEDISLLDDDPVKVRANSYDLVINGVELGGGSIRIHNSDLQKKIFNIMGYQESEVNRYFGFLIAALDHGAPPHGGLAIGLDRLCAMLGSSSSIKDFIAFPKNNAGKDTMIGAPAELQQG
jgi:aspartyl-tRNA synthetase